MSVQSLHFQLIDMAPPISRYGYNLDGFILNHVPLTTKFDDDWLKFTLPFGIKLIWHDFEPLAAILFRLST